MGAQEVINREKLAKNSTKEFWLNTGAGVAGKSAHSIAVTPEVVEKARTIAG